MKAFRKSLDFRKWLEKNHKRDEGLWVRIYKVDSGVVSITYAEALDEALCYGWIDGQKNGLDEKSWLQKFTPRRKKSLWSKRNREHVSRLIREDKMKAAGYLQIEEAKKDGRWKNAYDSMKTLKIPNDLKQALLKNSEANKFFKTLDRARLYSITFRPQTAKSPESRLRKLAAIVEGLETGKVRGLLQKKTK